MMVRILSILPGIIGVLCALIVLLSVIDYQPSDSGSVVPIVPCTDDDFGCNVGMSGNDMDVPLAFILLDIELDVDWNEPERGWIGVVSASAALECPPDSNGLTQCKAEDIESFLVAGGPQASGSMKFQVSPGAYRFVAGGHEGAGLDSQEIVMKTDVHLNNYVEIVLGVTSILLLAGAGEMAFPIRNLLKRFRDS